MERYTAKQCKNKLLIIECNNKEQAWKVLDAWDIKQSKHGFENSNYFTILYDSKYGCYGWVNENTHPKYYEKNKYLNGGRIHFRQIIDFEENLLNNIQIW